MEEEASTNSSSSKNRAPSSALVNSSLILGQVFFGLGSVIAALGLPACNPFAFALYRETSAGFILQGASIWSRRKDASGSYMLNPIYRNPVRFLLLGLAIFTNQAGAIVGIKLSGPIAAAIWQPSQPIMTAAICMALRWEPFNPWRVVGIGIAFGACALMVLLSNKGADAVANPTSNIVGNLLFFVNCLGTSLYVILSKKVLRLYASVTVTAWSYTIAALFMVVTALLASTSTSVMTFLCPDCKSTWKIPSGAFFALSYFILCNSVAAYAIMTWANQYATGTLVMGFTVLQPVTAALLTLLLLGVGAYSSCAEKNGGPCLDPPGWGSACGIMGVFAGLYLVITTEPKRPLDDDYGELAGDELELKGETISDDSCGLAEIEHDLVLEGEQAHDS